MNIPAYVTRFEVSTSLATNGKHAAKGMVVTGPNQGQFITADHQERDVAISSFMQKAKEVYEHSRRKG